MPCCVPLGRFPACASRAQLLQLYRRTGCVGREDRRGTAAEGSHRCRQDAGEGERNASVCRRMHFVGHRGEELMRSGLAVRCGYENKPSGLGLEQSP